MNKYVGVVPVCSAAALPRVAMADVPPKPQNVQQLLTWCEAPIEGDALSSTESLWCTAYVSGISEYMTGLGLVTALGSVRNSIATCPEVGTTLGAGIQAFINWAKANPKDWTYDPALGVSVALRQTWPCTFKK